MLYFFVLFVSGWLFLGFKCLVARRQCEREREGKTERERERERMEESLRCEG